MLLILYFRKYHYTCTSIYFQLQNKHHYNGRTADGSHKSGGDAIEELEGAFEIAERTCPGISDMFICELVQKLVPSISEQKLKVVLDKVVR